MSKKVAEKFGPNQEVYEVGDIIYLAKDEPLKLECGKEISDFPIAYQAYGKLNADKSNAVLICHGLTGDQYAASASPITGKTGWWDLVIGKGKPLDTEKLFLICANVLGGCMGSYGPKSINPKTGKDFGLDFPVITIGDMVRSQKLLLEHFGIKKLASVVGGSMGGMLALEWAVKYPKMVYSSVVIASASRHTAQNIAFHEIGRQTIMADPNWCGGRYIEQKRYPITGLSVARMTAHVTYLSEKGLQKKFDRGLQDRDEITYGFDADFQVESYLRYQGKSFVNRFDPNSYLYITRSMDYFDLVESNEGNLSKAFKNIDTKFCIISFSSDWLFPTSEAKHIVHALSASSSKVSFVEVETDKGHDAFLLNEPEFFKTLGGFIKGVQKELGI
jgi:homoserine O-acetyltransferase